jgi:hypothetical protein
MQCAQWAPTAADRIGMAYKVWIAKAKTAHNVLFLRDPLPLVTTDTANLTRDNPAAATSDVRAQLCCSKANEEAAPLRAMDAPKIEDVRCITSSRQTRQNHALLV